MHGFIGCVRQTDNGADRMLGWMRQWIDLGPSKEAFEVRRSPFLFLGSNEPSLTGNPMASDDSGLVLVFSGFIARDQLKEANRVGPQTDSEVAAALLRRYRQKGADSLAALNGRYVVCVWSSADGRLELMNDMLGLKPIFLWQQDRAFAFASNVWAIACHPMFRKTIEPKALVDLLLLSHQQGNRTLFKDVSLLPPGSVLTVSDGNVTSRLVRNLKFSDERWGWSTENVAEEMYALLSRSVRRRVPDGSQVLLPLSGGFDSRSLLGFLLERPVEINAITHCQNGLFGEDARYAKRLARQAGIRHKVVPLGYGFLARYRTKCVAINGGMYDIHTGRMFSLLGESQDASLLVSGHLGGELTGAFQISPALFSTPEEHSDVAFRLSVNEFRFTPEQVRGLLGPDVSKDLVDEAAEENRQFLMRQKGTFFQRYSNWDLLLSRRRYISYQLLYFEQFTPIRAPFYDTDLVDFMCSLPFAAIEEQRAYRAMLSRCFPLLAAIPNVKGLPTLPSTKLQCLLIAQYKRFIRRLLLRVVKHWSPSQMAHFGFGLKTDSRPVIEHILQNNQRIAPYLDPRRVQDAVDRQLSGDDSACMGVLGLSTFVTALEFLDDPYAAIGAWEDGLHVSSL